MSRIRFKAVAPLDGEEQRELVAIAARTDAGDPAKPAVGKPAPVRASPGQPMSGLVVERQSIELPDSAEGPVGAAQALMEAGKRDDKGLIGELLDGADLEGDELDS